MKKTAMKKVLQKTLISALASALILTMLPFAAFADETEPSGGEQKAKRTILLYDCGSDLETEAGLASFNLRQILSAEFSADDDIRFIVMTGGADKWHMKENELVFPEDVYVPEDAVSIGDRMNPHDPENPTTYDASKIKSQISNTYNQIWEAKGTDAPENAGKMVLLDGDGVLGDGENAKRSIIVKDDYEQYDDGSWHYNQDTLVEENYEWMNNPDVLRAFINYGVENFPAEKYDLILWDHGGGPDGGFGSDLHEPTHGFDLMWLHQIIDAIAHNKVVDPDEDGTPDAKFDFVNFDACLMNSVEIDILLSDYMDYYIASPESEPGYGQDYEGWLNDVGKEPEMNTYDLGKKIVDDFYDFYETGDGSEQDGTLAVVDMEKLMTTTVETAGGTRDFVQAMQDLNDLMQNELVWNQLIYDEFRSFQGSLSYGELPYYDLGNLVSLLSYVYYEADYEDLNEDGSIKDENVYTDTAKALLTILNDPDIIYARSTSGIRTKEQFFRDADENWDVVKGTQGTSGMFLCFTPLDVPEESFNHHIYMRQVFKKMDPDDARLKLLRDLNQTMIQYGLAFYAGAAVTDMVSSGTPEDSIDYDAVKTYWQTQTDQSGEDYWNSAVWYYIAALEEESDAETGDSEEDPAFARKEAAAKEWLGKAILNQRDEGVSKDRVQVKTVKTEAGTGCEITLNDVKKQAITNVSMNVIAELPATEKFLNDPANELYIENECAGMSTDLVIGTIQGKQVIDADLASKDYKRAVEWLFNGKSQWTLDPPPDKWYALEDATGDLHVAAVQMYGDTIDIPVGYFTTEPREVFDLDTEEIVLEEMPVCHVTYLTFEKDENGIYNLKELFFVLDDMGGYRIIPASEYKGEMEVVPLIEISDGFMSSFLPASENYFTVSEGTIGALQVKYMNAKDIPDIKDTGTDGKPLHSTVTVNNIYGRQIDISDLVSRAYEESGIKPGITKKANPLKVKAKTVTVKQKKLKKKQQKLKVSKVIRFVKKGQGSMTYKLVSAKKGKKSFKKYFRIDKKTGKVTIKKNKKMKKGTYKVKVKVKAAGTTYYNPSAWKTVTIKIKVK